jgi:hypothetical protein
MFTVTYVEQDGGMFMSYETCGYADRQQAEKRVRDFVQAACKTAPGLEIEALGTDSWVLSDGEGYQILIWIAELETKQ